VSEIDHYFRVFRPTDGWRKEGLIFGLFIIVIIVIIITTFVKEALFYSAIVCLSG